MSNGKINTAINEFNQLSKIVKESPNIKLFSKELKKHVKNQRI